LVFGARAGRAALEDSVKVEEISSDDAVLEPETRQPQAQRANSSEIAFAVRKRVRRLMWDRVGILRNREGLERALREFDQISMSPLSRASRNFLGVATMIARSALWREESRGAHYRTDFPAPNDVEWRMHSIIRKGEVISGVKELAEDARINSTA
jgi:succinate dehydrogenase/fumarate reductase flavoprotein subunit